MAGLKFCNREIEGTDCQGCYDEFVGGFVDVSKGAAFKFDVSRLMNATYIGLHNVY